MENVENVSDETSEDRLISAKPQFSDVKENLLRPRHLKDFVGQHKLKENLAIFMGAAKKRQESLEHILLYGPPGLGKTTLGNIIAFEMEGNIKTTSGPAIERPGDLAAILTNLEDGDILFIDEIHRLNHSVEEVLYPALEDYKLDIVIGKGPSARSIRLDVASFTLVGATTKAGMLSAPFRDRFGMVERLEFYSAEDLSKIVQRAASILNTRIDPDAAAEIAKRTRGTPRVANRILKRVRDWAEMKEDGVIRFKSVMNALSAMGVDHLGLDNIDRRYLETIITKFSGGPVGLDTLAASISEDKETIEDVYEPYLLQLGFLNRTPRGRMVTQHACNHLGLACPILDKTTSQSLLF